MSMRTMEKVKKKIKKKYLPYNSRKVHEDSCIFTMCVIISDGKQMWKVERQMSTHNKKITR